MGDKAKNTRGRPTYIRGEAGAVEEMLREYGESYWGPVWVRGCEVTEPGEVRVFKAFARAGAPGGGRAPK